MRTKKTVEFFCKTVFVATVLFLSSCKSVYKLGEVKTRSISDNRLYTTLLDSSLHYSTFYVKRFSANFSVDGVKKSFKGSLKIQKDSMILISINAPVGGLEVARLLVTPDSVKMIDRLKKEYIEGGFDFFTEKLEIDLNFNSLQGILTNSVYRASDEEKEKAFIRSFKGKTLENKYVFVSENARKINRKLKKDKLEKLSCFNYQRIEIDPALMRITDIVVKDFEVARNLRISYRDFKPYQTTKFPKRLDFEANDPKHLLTCQIKFNKIAVDEELKFSFKVSDKYERIYP